MRLVRRGGYDILHSHVNLSSGMILFLGSWAGVGPRIVHFRTTGDDSPDTSSRTMYRWLMRRLINRYANVILAVSNAAMEQSWSPRWRDDPRAMVIHNGLDLARLESAETDPVGVRTELSLAPESILAIAVGRIEAPKAHNVLLDSAAIAFAKNPLINLAIVGEGVLREETQRQAKRLGIEHRVHFLGLRDDVPRLLKASDVLVVSSRREGLPGSVLEAVAVGLPIVATSLPGVAEIATHTDLITMVPPEDPRSLALAWLDVVGNSCGDPHDHPFPEVFDLETCAERMRHVYRRATGADSEA